MSKKRYDSCVTTISNHVSDIAPLVTDGTFMTPFPFFLGLSSSVAQQTAGFIPFDCLNGIPSGRTDLNFMRHANMYTHFRIKAIRWEYTPATAVTGRESILACAALPVGAPEPERSNTILTGTYWLVKWPNKSGTFQDFGVNLSGPAGNNRLYNTAALMDPSTIKIPITEKFVLTWKPKVLGYKPQLFRPMNTVVGPATTAVQAYQVTAKKFPWSPIVDNVESVLVAPEDQAIGQQPVSSGGNLYNTQSLRMPMSFPMISCYDSVNNEFPASAVTYGRWTMQTVFEFKYKRDRAAVITGFLQEDVPLNNAAAVPSGQNISV